MSCRSGGAHQMNPYKEGTNLKGYSNYTCTQEPSTRRLIFHESGKSCKNVNAKNQTNRDCMVAREREDDDIQQ